MWTSSSANRHRQKKAPVALAALLLLMLGASANACAPELIASSASSAQVAACEHHLGTIDIANGRRAEAESHYVKALALWEQAGESWLPSLCTTLLNLGEVYRETNRPEEAEKMLLRAVDIAGRFRNQYPEEYPEALSRLGAVYSAKDQPERARPLFIESIELLRKLGPGKAAELAYCLNNLGLLNLGSGNYKLGEANLREAVTAALPVLGEENPESVAYQTNLSLAFVMQGQFERAEPLLRRGRFLIESRFGSTHPALIPIFGELSAVAAGMKKWGIAEEYARQAIVVLDAQQSPNPLAVALAKIGLAKLYLRERKAAEAERILPDAVAIERRISVNGRVLANGILQLAELRAMQQSWRESEGLYREAIGLYEAAPGRLDPGIGQVLHNYAEVLRHTGAPKSEVKTVETRAKALTGAAPSA